MAREWDADLIILGARTERFGESIVGTTAERVSRKARRPILVVNRDVAGPYQHVLLTSDLTKGSAEAASLADNVGLLDGGLTAVVHALSSAGVSMLRVSGVSEPAIQTYVRTMSQSTSHEILQQFEHAGVHTERMSVLAQQSSPLRAIEHAVQLTDADLVVVGSSEFPVLKRIVLGSISNEVLRTLTCDVLLVSAGAIKHARATLH
jgi:nucleotide-binding universal stress UspA family protein